MHDAEHTAKMAKNEVKKEVRQGKQKVKKVLAGVAVVAAAYGAKKLYDASHKAEDQMKKADREAKMEE